MKSSIREGLEPSVWSTYPTATLQNQLKTPNHAKYQPHNDYFNTESYKLTSHNRKYEVHLSSHGKHHACRQQRCNPQVLATTSHRQLPTPLQRHLRRRV